MPNSLVVYSEWLLTRRSRSVADAELSRINRLVKLIPDALRTKFVRREQSEDWVDESGRLVLIGEAAHPIMVRYTVVFLSSDVDAYSISAVWNP